MLGSLCAVLSLQSCPTLCDPMDYNPPGSSVQQENWSGLLRPPPGDLPDPGMKLTSLKCPALASGSLPLASWETHFVHYTL